MAAVARPAAAYPVTYVTVDDDLEKGGVEGDLAVAVDVARQGFVSKTLGILSAQLLVTAVIALAVTAWPPLTRLAASPASPVPLAAAAASLALVVYLSCSERARHEHPTNLIVLGAFTVAESFLVGAICAQYTLPSVLLAFGATGVSATAVAAYAAGAKRDLTAHGGAMLGALVALLCTSVLAALLRVRVAEGLIAGAGAVLFSAFLAADVQRLYDNQRPGGGGGGGGGEGGGGLFGSQHREQAFGPDEHVAAALAIYLDVINLLVYLLRLFGERRDS